MQPPSPVWQLLSALAYSLLPFGCASSFLILLEKKKGEQKCYMYQQQTEKLLLVFKSLWRMTILDNLWSFLLLQESSWSWAEVELLYNCNKVIFTCQRWKVPNASEFSMISKKYQSCHFYGVAFPQPEICIAKAACSNSSRTLLLWLAGKCLDFF